MSQHLYYKPLFSSLAFHSLRLSRQKSINSERRYYNRPSLQSYHTSMLQTPYRIAHARCLFPTSRSLLVTRHTLFHASPCLLLFPIQSDLLTDAALWYLRGYTENADTVAFMHNAGSVRYALTLSRLYIPLSPSHDVHIS